MISLKSLKISLKEGMKKIFFSARVNKTISMRIISVTNLREKPKTIPKYPISSWTMNTYKEIIETLVDAAQMGQK
jgi:hypothetical protein